MRIRKWWGPLVCLLALLLGLAGWRTAGAQRNERYFPETGHIVTGEFLAFYESVDDPLLLYGAPITDAFVDPIYGRLMQYFQKARFELYPDQPAELRVKLSPLGKYTHPIGLPRVLPASSVGCQTFTETDASFQVCYAFLDFFNAHGGVSQFGYPISGMEIQDGRVVQTFQKARFEWRPELTSGKRVQLAELGRIYFDQQALDQKYLRQKDNLPQTILQLGVRAYPERPVTSLQGKQNVFVIVQDQNRLPVGGAVVELTVRMPAGEGQDIHLQSTTDKNGIARFGFYFQTTRPELVPLEITASLDDMQTNTTSSFRTWW